MDEPLDDFLSSFFPFVKTNSETVDYKVTGYNSVHGSKWKTKSRKDRFPRDGGKPIKASVPGYDKIPWSNARLTLIGLNPDGYVAYAKTWAEKKEFAFSSFKTILVCWPGQYSQDIFVIDDMKAFRKALGFSKKSEAVLVDEDGEEWIGR